MWERRSRTSACGSFAALSRPSGPARYRIPGLRDWLVRPRSRQPFRGLGIFLQIDHSQFNKYFHSFFHSFIHHLRFRLPRSDPTLRIHPTLTRAPLPTPMAGWPDLRLLPKP
uniref:Uncharacterized protein n=1 Tax=Oryza barthii TaxID=65489 RepID=A0A0D3HTM7_9ORYZ